MLALTPREKNLLLACFAALLLVGGMIAASVFLEKRRVASERITTLEAELQESRHFFEEREYWNKRSTWLRSTMPRAESLGQAQAILLEDVQNEALDLALTVQSQRLLEPASSDSYREVAIEVKLRGPQETLLGWLTTLQSPERFQAVKQLEIEIDSRAKEKVPMAFCNLILARWFQPEAGL
jgi:type II secretory pathway component PulM